MTPTPTLLNRVNILPCIVLCLSLLGLAGQSPDFGHPAIFISFTGLFAVALYVLNFGASLILFFAWSVVQLFVVCPADAAHVTAATGLADLTQGFKLPVYLPVPVAGAGYRVGLNLVAVFCMGLMWFTRHKEIIGSNLTFSSYRHDNRLGVVFPVTGRAERFVNLSGERYWLLVSMEEPFTYNGRIISHALVNRNDKSPVVKDCINQLVFFKPIADPGGIKEGENRKADFADEVWALCK